MSTLLLKRPVAHPHHRNGKLVRLQILKFAAVFGIVVATSLMVINSTDNSFPDENSLLKLSALPGEFQLFPDDPPSKKVQKRLVKSASTRSVSFQGNSTSFLDLGSELESILDKSSVTELYLQNVTLNPETFSTTLGEFSGLEVLRLESIKSVTGGWGFTRAYLPRLREFVVDLDIGFHDQYTEYTQDLTEDKLLQIVFYDKSSQVGTDLGTKLAIDKVQVVLRVDGWTALSLITTDEDQTAYRAVVAVKSAESIMQKLIQNEIRIVHLTMTECSVSMSSFPKGLKYLNLYRVVVIDGDIMDVLQPLTNLTQLYLEIRNTTLRFSDIPRTVETLAISDINRVEPGDVSYAEIIALGAPLDSTIVDNFDKVFINVKKLGIFEPTNGTQHQLLKNALRTNAIWIYLEGFERLQDGGEISDVEKEMEGFLGGLRVLSSERHVLIGRETPLDDWRQIELSKTQQLGFRYKMLGWDEYISWDVYINNF